MKTSLRFIYTGQVVGKIQEARIKLHLLVEGNWDQKCQEQWSCALKKQT